MMITRHDIEALSDIAKRNRDEEQAYRERERWHRVAIWWAIFGVFAVSVAVHGK